MELKSKLPFFLVLFVIISCVTPNYVTNITSYDELHSTQKKTATIVGLDQVFIHNYEKTFNKNYASTLAFSQNVSEEFANALVENGFVSASNVDLSADWEHINTMTSKRSYMTIQALFEKTKTDYLVCLDNFKVKRKMIVDQNVAPSNMNTTSTTSREYIILETTIKVYDVKTHEPVIEFDVMGEDQIVFFSYSKSMQDAKEKLIQHSLEFLQSKTK